MITKFKFNDKGITYKYKNKIKIIPFKSIKDIEIDEETISIAARACEDGCAELDLIFITIYIDNPIFEDAKKQILDYYSWETGKEESDSIKEIELSEYDKLTKAYDELQRLKNKVYTADPTITI